MKFLVKGTDKTQTTLILSRIERDYSAENIEKELGSIPGKVAQKLGKFTNIPLALNASWKRLSDTEISLEVILPFENFNIPSGSLPDKFKAILSNPLLLFNLKKVYRKAIKKGFKEEFPRCSIEAVPDG